MQTPNKRTATPLNKCHFVIEGQLIKGEHQSIVVEKNVPIDKA